VPVPGRHLYADGQRALVEDVGDSDVLDWKAVASSDGRDEMTMPRSSMKIRCTQSIVVLASRAGFTVKTLSYLFLK
jgi:hypothetical protein